MKQIQQLTTNLKNFISIFENSEKELDFINQVKDFSHLLFFTNEFNNKKSLIDVSKVDMIEHLVMSFAHNYTLMVWGKDYSENESELFKRLPSLTFLKKDDVASSYEALKVLVQKTVDYCYENSYKAKYFNEYIVNYKNQQYYLGGEVELAPIIAFDLDGTVVNSTTRIQKMQQEKDNLSENLSKKTKGIKKFNILKNFHRSVESDTPYKHMVDLIYAYKDAGFDIMVLTARPNEYIELNKEFLAKFNIPVDIYVGRPVNNGMPDTEGKYSWLNENVAKERVRGFFEDRKEIIEFFNKKDRVKIYDVDEYHKNPTEEKMKSLVKDCIKRKNVCEEFFLLKNEKENYKYFYRKAEEYYAKKNGVPFEETEKKRLELRNHKFKPNIS